MITSILNPNVGTATMLGPTSIRWNIAELGVSAPQSAALEFFVRHVAQTSGTKKVNASVDYSDNEGNVVDFPDPTVAVECDVVVHPEPCAVPTDLSVDGCSDAVVVDMGDTYLESLGRIIQLDVTVRNVCPGKRVALAVILTEVDENGEEYQRGMKAMTIPPTIRRPAATFWCAASSSSCRRIWTFRAIRAVCATSATSRRALLRTTSTRITAAATSF